MPRFSAVARGLDCIREIGRRGPRHGKALGKQRLSPPVPAAHRLRAGKMLGRFPAVGRSGSTTHRVHECAGRSAGARRAIRRERPSQCPHVAERSTRRASRQRGTRRSPRATGWLARISDDGASPRWVFERHLCSGSGCAVASPRTGTGTSASNAHRTSPPRTRWSGDSDYGCPCSSSRNCIGPRGGRYCITSGGNKRYR